MESRERRRVGAVASRSRGSRTLAVTMASGAPRFARRAADHRGDAGMVPRVSLDGAEYIVVSRLSKRVLG